MTTIPEGREPAFPFKCQGPTTAPEFYYGMTLRDYFAAKAIGVIISVLAREDLDFLASEVVRQECALQAYLMADAMIEQRNK